VKVEVDVLTEPLLPSPDVVSRRVAGEYLLVPVRSGVAQIDYLFTANETGSEIFRLLDGTRDGRAIGAACTHIHGQRLALCLCNAPRVIKSLDIVRMIVDGGIQSFARRFSLRMAGIILPLLIDETARAIRIESGNHDRD